MSISSRRVAGEVTPVKRHPVSRSQGTSRFTTPLQRLLVFLSPLELPVVQIEGSSYRLRQHAKLMPENLKSGPPTTRRRGRPRKEVAEDE